jgi:CBS domain-containing membrane protein
MNYLAKDSMTAGLVTINWKASLNAAYQLMKSRSIRHLPVKNELGNIVGVISERDLLRAMKSEVRNEFETEFASANFSANDLVKDFMSWPVKTVDSKDSIQSVVHKILNEKISSVLVKDVTGDIRGIITTDDLISLLLTFLNDDSERKNFEVEKFFDPSWLAYAT